MERYDSECCTGKSTITTIKEHKQHATGYEKMWRETYGDIAFTNTASGFDRTYALVQSTALGKVKVETGPGMSGDAREFYLYRMMQTVMYLNWRQQLYPRFDVSHKLHGPLLETQLRGARKEDLRLPFDAFFVTLPEPINGWRRAMVGYVPKSEKGQDGLVATFWSAVVPDTEIGSREVEAATIQEAPEESDDIREWLRRQVDSGKRRVEYLLRDGGIKRDVVGDPDRSTGSAMEYLCNVLVLINNGCAQEVAAATAAAKAGMRKGKCRDIHCVLGHSIRLSPQAAALGKMKRRGARCGYRISSRFIVRGHWRNQACGKDRLDRRRIWIQPYWKGPADATEALERAYRLGD